jgi:hypothetical protein
MPPDTELDYDCSITFTALDPLDGSTVTGVTVSNMSIYFDDVGGGGSFEYGKFLLVPGPGA